MRLSSPVQIAEQGHELSDKLLRPMRRHYSEDGGMEITNDLVNNTTSFVFYLSGDAYSAPAIWKEVHASSAVTQNLYYLHRDHLGSIVLITDNQGNAVEKRQFDAWGNIVKLTDGNGNPLTAFVIIDRGYTGHEHLFGVGLIHMNGRLYDPKLHRFLSPDNFVQDPSNSQNFNRYGYVLNNPLKFTDPSGEFIFAVLIPILIKAVIVGAAIGGAGYTASVALSNGGFNNWNGGQFWKSVGIGAISGVVTAGIGSAFGEVGKFGHELLRAGAHGLANGTISDLSGGSFGSGFLSGGLGSLGGSGFQALAGDFAKSAVGTIGFSAVSGGIGAELTGDDFWRGAGTGAIVGTLNHLAHGIDDKQKKAAQQEAARKKAEGLSTGLGVYANTKEGILMFAKKTGDLGVAGEYTLKATKWLGRISGLTQVGIAGTELYNSGFKSPGAWTKFGVSVLTLRANPYVGLGMGIVDAAGGTQWFYNKIDQYYAK